MLSALLACAPPPPDWGDSARCDTGTVDLPEQASEIPLRLAATVGAAGQWLPLSPAAADLTGDGQADLLFGAKFEPVFLLEGPIRPIDSSARATATWDPADPIVGMWPAGDLDGDGIADAVAVQRVPEEVVVIDSGPLVGQRAFAGALSMEPDFLDIGEVSAGNDLDGDGVADVAFAGGRGQLRVYLGPVMDLSADAADQLLPQTDEMWDFGPHLTAGDFDGDGTLDLAAEVSPRDSDAVVYIYTSPLNSDGPTAVLRGWYGIGALVQADTDADGSDDLFVYDGGDVRLFRGPLIGDVAAEDAARTVTLLPWEAGADSASIAVVPDATGDGSPDLWIGTPGRTGGWHDIETHCCCLDDLQGGVWLVEGGRSGPSTLDRASAFVPGRIPWRHLGYSVGGGADLDGNGAPDLIATSADGAGTVLLFNAEE